MSLSTQPLYSRALGAATGSGTSGVLPTPYVELARLDINVTALTGGTTPDITFSLQVLGADGVTWWTVWTGTPITAATVPPVGFNFGPDTATPLVFTGACRLVWTFGGAVAATSITFAASLVGRG